MIKIPAKRIYDIDHKIVKDNAINRVATPAINDVTLTSNAEAVVDTRDILSDLAYYPDASGNYKRNSTNASQNYGNATVDYVEVDNFVYARIAVIKKEFKIPKYQYEKSIKNIINNFASKTSAGAKCKITYIKGTYPASGTLNVKHTVTSATEYIDVSNSWPSEVIRGDVEFDGTIYTEELYPTADDDKTDFNADYSTSTDLTFSHTISKRASVTSNIITSTASVSFNRTSGDTVGNSLSVTLDSDRKYYTVKINIYCQYDWHYLQYVYSGYDGWKVADELWDSTNNVPKPRELTGTGYVAIPQAVELSLYGDFITIRLGDTNSIVVTSGDGQNVYSVSGNELLQVANYYQKSYWDTRPAIISDAEDTINEYVQGKEVLVLKCSVNDYYDYDTGEKVIDTSTTSKMLFNVGDIVVPMKKTTSGSELPISTKVDGTAKCFEVIGIDVGTKGIIWQTLTLFEKTL